MKFILVAWAAYIIYTDPVDPLSPSGVFFEISDLKLYVNQKCF